VTEGGGFIRFVRLALNVVVQNALGLLGCNPAIALDLTFTNSLFCPTPCIYAFCMDLRTNRDYFLILN
jgi:hypothetical protein